MKYVHGHVDTSSSTRQLTHRVKGTY